MRRIALIVFLILFVGLAGAADTPIKVKTLPNHKTLVYALDADQVYFLLESFHKTSDANGIVSVVHSGTKSKINVRVIVKDETGKNIVSEKFGPYSAGSAVSILALPDKLDGEYKEAPAAPPASPVAPKNDTPAKPAAPPAQNNSLNNTGNSTAKNKSSEGNLLSGFAIGGLNGTVSLILGIIITLMVLAGAFFGGMKFEEHRAVKSGSPAHSDKAIEKKLKYTERELEDAQAEISKLKNRDKILEMEKKIEDEKRELEKLKKGYK